MKKSNIDWFEFRYLWWKRYRDFTYPFRLFCYRICNFFKWGWRCRDIYDGDWSYLIRLMEMQLNDGAKAMKEENRHVGSLRQSRKMAYCAALCRRINSNYYWDQLDVKGSIGDGTFSDKAAIIDAKEKRDFTRLFTILEKNIRHWWI